MNVRTAALGARTQQSYSLSALQNCLKSELCPMKYGVKGNKLFSFRKCLTNCSSTDSLLKDYKKFYKKKPEERRKTRKQVLYRMEKEIKEL